MSAHNAMTVFGEVVTDDPRDARIDALERDVYRLEGELAAAREATRKAHSDIERAVANLRRQLSPLHQALRQVFGEIDAVLPESETPPYSGTPSVGNQNTDRVTKIWDSWKARFPGRAAQIIDALMLQPGMNAGQLAIAIGCHRNSIPDLIYKLNKAGLIRKSGNAFFLKDL